MNPKLTISADTVHIQFLAAPIDHIATPEIVVDYDLEGNPVGFEAFDFKTPPWGEIAQFDTPQIRAVFTPEDNAMSVRFEKNPHSSDQETLAAEFGLSITDQLVSIKFNYIRGNAARKHRTAKGWKLQ